MAASHCDADSRKYFNRSVSPLYGIEVCAIELGQGLACSQGLDRRGRTRDRNPDAAHSQRTLSFWTFFGEVEFQEREIGGPWVMNRIKKGSFYLTTGGPPYECRWKVLTPEPFLSLMVFVELPLLQRAMEEVFGVDAPKVRLRDLSAFTDPDLSWLMECVREELLARRASALRVQGLAHMIATHLARIYAEVAPEAVSGRPSLPGFKLKQVTDWIEEHLADEFDLERLAAQAGLSKFHFHRLFREATGVSPAKYQLNARMNGARRLLRETKQSIATISVDFGLFNRQPSRASFPPRNQHAAERVSPAALSCRDLWRARGARTPFGRGMRTGLGIFTIPTASARM